MGARLRSVDPITSEYTQLGARPTRVIVPDQGGLSEDDLIVLLFILDGEDQANE